LKKKNNPQDRNDFVGAKGSTGSPLPIDSVSELDVPRLCVSLGEELNRSAIYRRDWPAYTARISPDAPVTLLGQVKRRI
jgi:hypothetical protein